MQFAEDLPKECIPRLKQINLIEAEEPTKHGCTSCTNLNDTSTI